MVLLCLFYGSVMFLFMVLLCFRMVLYGFVMISYGFVMVKLNPKGTVISGRVGGGINFFN